MKCNPCSRKGACRKKDCFYGHLCQKDGCTGQGGSGPKACRFKPDLHYRGEECRVGSLVPAVEDDVREGDDFMW